MSSEVDICVSTRAGETKTVAAKKAKKLINRLQKGQSLRQATRAEHVTQADLQNAESAIGIALRELVGRNFLPAEARRQMVRAGLNKLFMDNVSSDDPAAQKIALDAAKQIGADPEVGLNHGESGGVVVNIGELEAVFTQLSNEVPKIIDGREVVDAEVLDADTNSGE